MNDRMNLEFKKRWLQWVLDFIQMDLGSLSPLNRKKLAKEILYFCSSDLFKIDWEDFEYNTGLSPEERGTLLNKDLSEVETNPHPIQEKLREVIQIIEEMSSGIDPLMYILPKTSPFLFVGWLGKEPNIFSEGVFVTESQPTPPSLENWVVLNLTQLISGLEVHSIKKCSGCKKYFLNLTRIKKIYCNPACASRSIGHKRYEELKKDSKKYEAHLKKYRKLSSERYKRLRQMQFGPNVKIQKRRNHKKEV
jgi:hypothetical protein